jgi:hypothetical protein
LSSRDTQADLIHGGDVGVLALFAPAATEGEVFTEAMTYGRSKTIAL